jgi:hypothetical protein
MIRTILYFLLYSVKRDLKINLFAKVLKHVMCMIAVDFTSVIKIRIFNAYETIEI